MTYLEKAKKFNSKFDIVKLKTVCPKDIGLENSSPCEIYKGNCEMCWNREMPMIVECEMEDKSVTMQDALDKWNEESYNQGLNDGRNEVWELAKKLHLNKCDYEDALNDNEIRKIFGTPDLAEVMELSPQEALSKMKAYEEAQKIKVGDVVEIISKSSKSGNFYGIILTLGLDEYYVLTTNYTVPQKLPKNNYVFKKTGKHVDFISILDQIGE